MPYETSAQPPPRPVIAPWLHTAALLLILTMVTLSGRTRAASGNYLDSSRIAYYISSSLAEWLLLGAVIAGIYCRGNFFLTTLQQRARSIASTLGLGVLLYLISIFALALLRGMLHFTPIPQTVNLDVLLAMTPHTPSEFSVWLVVSLSAGICEELIFRGYLMQQVTAWTASPIAAILITGVLFGCVHLYEGLGAILPLATLGILYGFATLYFKGDLRPVIVAHFLQDFIVAFVFNATRQLPHPPTL